MAFPTYGTSVPTLALNDFSFNGVTFGNLLQSPHSNYQLVSANGLDLTPMTTGDVARPFQGGEFIGYDTPQGRDVVLQFVISTTSASALESARNTLATVFQATGRTQFPLYFKTNNGTVYATMARVRKFTYPLLDLTAYQAFGCTVTVQFRCSDWRIYSTPTQQATATFTASAGNASCVVGGSAYVNPVIVITAAGICNPLITATNFSLDFTAYQMASGDVLTIDTDFKTAVLAPFARPPSFSLIPYLAYPASWGPLPASTTTVVSATDSSGGGNTHTLAVQWANAFAAV